MFTKLTKIKDLWHKVKVGPTTSSDKDNIVALCGQLSPYRTPMALVDTKTDSDPDCEVCKSQ